MLLDPRKDSNGLAGHALRNANLRRRALVRAQTAPPLAGTIVRIRAQTLGMTRLEFSRRSGINRGTLRDLELGVHTPTRRILKQFVSFCQRCAVSPEQLEELRRLYAGLGDTLEQFIARLELRAGSPRELARRVGISPATLWEYRRGNFPMPLALLRRLCQTVGEDSAPAETLWHAGELHRLLERGYPEALAEFWVLCARAGCAERHLLKQGMSSASARRLRYLEMPAWQEVAKICRGLCRSEREFLSLKKLWIGAEHEQRKQARNAFGARLIQHRKQQGISRRKLADLFGIGGKKPARIIKHIEEDGFYSAQAYPAGLVAILEPDSRKHARLLDLWKARRMQFHRRRRPETRTDLRLMRELYGFRLRDMERILGYSSLEYQRIERGTSPLPDSARTRILHRVSETGLGRIEALLQLRSALEAEQSAWQSPSTVRELIALLALHEGGLIPLMRFLRKAGLKGLWTGRLRALGQGKEIPAWLVLEQIGKACGIADLTQVRLDWEQRYRAQLQAHCNSPLGVELRLLIADSAPTLRAFSPKLGFNYSVLIRDLQRIDRDVPVRWFHVERILRAAGLPEDDEHWREIHALWYTTRERRKPTPEAKTDKAPFSSPPARR